MGDSPELQTFPAAEDDQKGEIQQESESESNSASPLNIPDRGVADPPRVHGRRRFPRRKYFDVRDRSKVELVMVVLDVLIFGAASGLVVYSFVGTEPHYLTAYSSLLTASYILRLFYKWYRVQGGFDTFYSLLDDFQPGAIGLVVALWGTNGSVLFAVNVFSICFQGINIAIHWCQSYIKIPIRGNVKKLLRAKQFRDRYEEIGISGLLPCNEATNEIKESPIIDGEYYTLEKIDHETPVNDVETPVSDVETPVSDVETPVSDVETPASLSVKNKRNWIIGKMMVSYSDNGKWVTIKQKAEERAVKIFMERFAEEQKCNFIRMMEAWEERPSQGILKKIGRKRSHCFTLARLIDLTNRGFSVYLEKTELRTIKVGEEVDTGVEDFIDSIREILEVVYNRAAQQVSIIVAIIGVVVMFNLSTV